MVVEASIGDRSRGLFASTCHKKVSVTKYNAPSYLRGLFVGLGFGMSTEGVRYYTGRFGTQVAST